MKLSRGIRPTGIYSKLVRVFVLQVLFISIITVLGVYAAANIVEKVLVKKALEGEAQHFWTLYDSNSDQPTPNTDNLEGFIAKNGDLSEIPEAIKSIGPGFGRVQFNNRNPLIYVQDRNNNRLFLIFDEESVSNLGFYFGVVPLSLALIVIYISAWFSYRQSRKTLSPMVSLANIVRDFNFSKHDLDALEIDHLNTINTDDEVRTLIDALNVFTRRIRELVTRERQFTRDASHELRTPLAVILGSAELLARDRTLTEKQQQAISRIISTCKDMNSLVETLLLLARGSDPAQLTESVVVNDVVNLLVEQIDSSHNIDKHVSLNVISNNVLSVSAPAQAVGIVLGNLIRNACNYTQEGQIDIIIDQGSVTVSDTGHGMAMEEIPTLIKPFERSASVDAGTPGHGLGLDIVKRLCERFSWRLKIDSSLGAGTSICVNFAGD